jgi:hypothetical protein
MALTGSAPEGTGQSASSNGASGASSDEQSAFAKRRSTDQEIACAIDLGWRMAELYGLRASELPKDSSEDLLPARSRLPAGERLQLEVLAAAGDAERVGATIEEQRLAKLLEMAERAGSARTYEEEAFRAELARCHVELEKRLWAKHEARGKAYELGNSLSDTWNRVVRALRQPEWGDSNPASRVVAELRAVFSDDRKQRIKILLDELQARIDPAAVRVVQRHLDEWSERVKDCLPGDDQPPVTGFEPSQKGLEPLRRQALIWRQLLSGDKEPEAYIERGERTRLRGLLARRIWDDYMRRHWRRVLAVACAVAVVAVFFVWLVSWYGDHKALATVAVGFVSSIAGAVGLTTASITAALRRSDRAWSELVWNTTLTEVISEETIQVRDLLPTPDELTEEQGLGLPDTVMRPVRRLHVRRRPEPQA